MQSSIFIKNSKTPTYEQELALSSCVLLRQKRLSEPQDGSGRQLGVQGSKVLPPIPAVTSCAEATLRHSLQYLWIFYIRTVLSRLATACSKVEQE